MTADSSSFYKSIGTAELEAARNVRFDRTFYEYPFRGPAEAYKVRHCLPLEFEAYGALVLPWRAGDPEGRGLAKRPFETIAEAYAYFGLPTPTPLTLERWRTDFQIVEDVRTIPSLARSAFDRFSDQADTVFVRCHHDEVHNWRIERSIFLELSDPFAEKPCPLGSFGIFPRGASWYLHHRDDAAILYLAGSASLVDQLERVCSDRFFKLTLDDLYW